MRKELLALFLALALVLSAGLWESRQTKQQAQHDWTIYVEQTYPHYQWGRVPGNFSSLQVCEYVAMKYNLRPFVCAH